jgi:hypothetical protein
MYQFLPSMLLNEAQKQQRTIEELRMQLQSNAAEIAQLRAAVAAIAKGVTK